jgi:hypothetical protein
MPRALKIAILCGAVPLLLGTLIYTAWRFTRWPWLETAGLFVIFAGLISVTFAAVLLVRHLYRDFRVSRSFRTTNWFQVMVVGAILLLNFPAATIFTVSAINLVTRYTIHVSNQSGTSIESFVVTGPGVLVELGPIASGQRVQHHLQFAGDGSLDFTARQGQSEFSDQLEGYVTGGWGGDTTIRVLPERRYEIQKRNGATANDRSRSWLI